jgi:outer membrane protein assembly factor BamD
MIEKRANRHLMVMRTVNRVGAILVALSMLLFVFGCAGGLGKVPNSPEGILERGDAYFQRKMYFHSQEMYKAFLLRYPGHDRSDHAQFMLGMSLYNGKEYALAAIEFHLVVTNYGYSELVDDAYLQEALSLEKQAPKSSLDQRKREEALEKLERFMTVFPQSDKIAVAQEAIERIRAVLAEKCFKNGKFYYRRKRYRSAEIYFKKIIDRYPNNEYWANAGYYQGLIFLKRNDRDEAIRMFSLVMSYPENVEAKRASEFELRKLRQRDD